MTDTKIRGHVFQASYGNICASLVVQGDKVVNAAPVLHWACGRPWADVYRILIGRNAKIEEVKNDSTVD